MERTIYKNSEIWFTESEKYYVTELENYMLKTQHMLYWFAHLMGGDTEEDSLQKQLSMVSELDKSMSQNQRNICYVMREINVTE